MKLNQKIPIYANNSWRLSYTVERMKGGLKMTFGAEGAHGLGAGIAVVVVIILLLIAMGIVF